MTRSIADTLTRGVCVKRLACAAHEAGHGFVFDQAGFTVEEMRIWPDPPGWLGANRVVPVVLDATQAALVAAWQVGVMAGAAATYRFFRTYSDIGARGAREIAEASAGHGDLAEFDRIGRATGVGLSRAEARRRADALVERGGRRIDHLTVQLADRCRLSGRAL